MHASELWEDPGVGPTFARIALWPLSLIYCIGWECYLGVYRFGLKRAAHPHSPILCVGNLVSGGSGKTPVTIHLVNVLRELSHAVTVSCSGYGSPKSEAANVAPGGELDPKSWGDEAALFRSLFPDLDLVVGRRRTLAAELCNKHFPGSILLLDDGFQHLPLKKDLSIILDSSQPKNRMCLPAGPYREARWNRTRADLVLPGEFEIVESTQIVDLAGNAMPDVPACALLCAVGRPQNVINALEYKGVRVEPKFLLPDHDPLSAGTLIQNLPTEVPTVVTAKDWVKLRGREDVRDREFLVLRHEARIEPETEFRDWLQKHLDAIKEANIPR